MCRRCGAALVMDLNGVISCHACKAREHGEIDALIHPAEVDIRVTHRWLQITDEKRVSS